ncbi:MAG: alpha-L-rhamnosidase-related protein [Thermoguttaceae bacterium]
MKYFLLSCLAACCLARLPVPSALAIETLSFQSGRPAWAKDRAEEMNLSLGFRAPVQVNDTTDKTVLRVAASTIYRAWVNGQLVAQGPARGPHGFYRVDVIDVSPQLKPGHNLVAIEVAGYNANSYYLLDQPSFLQAELVQGPNVLASTLGEGQTFQAGTLDYRIQKVQRYSFQRPFIEVYRLSPESLRWITDVKADMASPVELVAQEDKILLPRRVLQPELNRLPPVRHVSAGKIERLADLPKPWKDRSLTDIGPELKGYPEADLELVVSTDMQKLVSVADAPLDATWNDRPALALEADRYQVVDMGVNRTGMIGAAVSCQAKTVLLLAFDEILTDTPRAAGDVNFRRLGCVNTVRYELDPGTYRLETIEPYTFRYLKTICLEGNCKVDDLYLREFAHPATPRAQFAASDERLNRLYAAGVETFRQNTLDVFMDCPSRERAGWLCDSLFTARVAPDLTGTTVVERAFLENYLLPDRFAHLPDGMLPMCYPADHYNGNFIPNWSLFFVLEVEEYLARSGDQVMIDALRRRIYQLMDYFRKFENDDGLLEKLEAWVFVEWSEANKFVQDVNYPSNMLYAAALAAAGRIYHDPDLVAKADKIRQVIRRQSYDGQFFVDNAVRKEGKLEVTRNRSEVCQYFAFYFDVASPETDPELWKILRDEFGPDRKDTKAWSDVHLANSFIGNVLRMELLSREGRAQQILDESIAYLLYMADRTGTLWENVGAYASCNHGFASHVVHTLNRDILGVYELDRPNQIVRLRLGDADLQWCEGRIPVGDGEVSLRWEKDAKTLRYRLGLPEGFKVEIDNRSGRELVKME